QRDVLAPRATSELMIAGFAEVFLVRFAVPIRQMRELERNQHSLAHHRRSQTGAESEKQHAAAFVAAERLHRGIVDDADGLFERRFEIEANPTASKVPRVACRTSVDDRAGVANRDGVV